LEEQAYTPLLIGKNIVESKASTKKVSNNLAFFNTRCFYRHRRPTSRRQPWRTAGATSTHGGWVVWQRAPARLRLPRRRRPCATRRPSPHEPPRRPRREESDTAATSTGFTGGLPPAEAHAGARGLARVTTPFPAQIPAACFVLTTGGWATRAARKPLSAAMANDREGLPAAGPQRRPPVNSLAPRSQPGRRTARAMALCSIAAAPGKDSAKCARRTSAAWPRRGLPNATARRSPFTGVA
jgi:hypothetical protein